MEEKTSNLFGEWVNDESLTNLFQNARPFPHVTIDQFLVPELAESLHVQFPVYCPDHWFEYRNPLELKFAHNDIQKMPQTFQNLFDALASPTIINIFRKITGIPDLEADEYLHGSGLHLHPRNGRLMLHLDYEKHPLSGKQRRLNLILYLSKDWDPAWKGATELWDESVTRCEVSSEVVFNRAIVFQTNEMSWHGVPEIIRCPRGTYRKTLAFYYMSPLTSAPNDEKVGANQEGFRTKACFKQRPQDTKDAGIDALLAIRPHRRLTAEDVRHHCPNWI